MSSTPSKTLAAASSVNRSLLAPRAAPRCSSSRPMLGTAPAAPPPTPTTSSSLPSRRMTGTQPVVWISTFGVRWDRQSFHQPGVLHPLALATGFHTAKAPVDDLNFGPRVGFAYQPFANGGTVIRGGGGIFFGNTPSILLGTASS